jgi:hypothetical protein
MSMLSAFSIRYPVRNCNATSVRRQKRSTPPNARADACHDHGLSVVLDVVYNHLGPDGNYLARAGHEPRRPRQRRGPAIPLRQCPHVVPRLSPRRSPARRGACADRHLRHVVSRAARRGHSGWPAPRVCRVRLGSERGARPPGPGDVCPRRRRDPRAGAAEADVLVVGGGPAGLGAALGAAAAGAQVVPSSATGSSGATPPRRS